MRQGGGNREGEVAILLSGDIRVKNHRMRDGVEKIEIKGLGFWGKV